MEKDFLRVLAVEEFLHLLRDFPPTPVENLSLSPMPLYTAHRKNTEEIHGTPCPGDAPGCDFAGLDGRVLASSVLSPENLPPFDRAVMDGYAVAAADVFGASDSAPAYLECTGDICIDRLPDFALNPGECAAIVTGAGLPRNADAVVMVEHSAVMGDTTIEIRRPVAPGQHVMLTGEDVRQGESALNAGTRLRPQEIGLLAALGVTQLSVRKRPVVAVISTGDELIDAHSPRTSYAPGQIRDVNSHALAALIRRAGGTPLLLGIVRDELPALHAALSDALRHADAVMLSGGSSMGVRDLTIEALRSIPGADVLAHGVALSPGKPTILGAVPHTEADGSRTKKAVWGLPGQVASAQVVMYALGMPFIRHIHGEQRAFDLSRIPARRAVLARNIASKQGREDWIRVRLADATTDEISGPAALSQNNATAQYTVPIAIPQPGLSGLLRTLLDADGFVRIPANTEGLLQGEEVTVHLV